MVVDLQHKAALAARLKNMEAQLLRGNAEISKAKQQQRELKRAQLRLEEQKKMGEVDCLRYSSKHLNKKRILGW